MIIGGSGGGGGGAVFLFSLVCSFVCCSREWGKLTALVCGWTLKAQYTATPPFWVETKQSFEVRSV